MRVVHSGLSFLLGHLAVGVAACLTPLLCNALKSFTHAGGQLFHDIMFTARKSTQPKCSCFGKNVCLWEYTLKVQMKLVYDESIWTLQFIRKVVRLN